MRILFLLLISFSSYGQALNLLGFNRQREANTPISGTVTYIDNAVEGTGNNQVNYVGTGWSVQAAKIESYAGTFRYSNVEDDYAEADFDGFKVELVAELFPSHGKVAVSIDGGAETEVDLYSAIVVTWNPNGEAAVVWSSGTITNGNHTIKVRITDQKNAASSGYYGVIDAFRVTSDETTPPPVTPTGDWFVGYAGASDSNAGTGSGSGQSFATIQKASEVAQPGDKITINTGTYRETITPTNSGTSVNPIIYEACSGCTVVISGAESISNGAWTNHTGNIYKATIDFGEPLFDEYMTGFNNENFEYNNTEILAQQVFQNGEMQFLAQYPKVDSPEDLLERESMIGRNLATTFTQTSINDDPLDDFGSLTGAYVWVNGWFLTYTRAISSHTGTTIGFSSTDGNISFSKFYRVFGKLNLLTAAEEWFWDDPTNTLYLWQAGGGSPTSVEYKQRNWGFDLRNRSYITIRGLEFFACEPVMTNASSNNTTIDNIEVKYQNHSVLETKAGADGYHDSAVQTGLKLLGANSVVKNSEFRYAAAMGIWAGSNTTIDNNYFYVGGYCGQYSGFIKPIWGAGNITITDNTFSRSGRGAIELSPENSASNLNLQINHNDFGMFNMLNVDGGAIYGARMVNLTGSRINHNWFHNDGGYDEAGVGKQAGIQINGVYFDQASGPATIDHNIFWNGIGNGADIYNQIVYGGRTTTGTLIYNNTFASVTSSYGGGTAATYACYDQSVSDVQRNNVYRMRTYIGPAGNLPGNIANSLMYTTNPLFVGGNPPTDNVTPIANPQTYFGLQSGSPARGIATALPGINDDDPAPRDAGAIPFGGPTWVPGYIDVAYTPTP